MTGGTPSTTRRSGRSWASSRGSVSKRGCAPRCAGTSTTNRGGGRSRPASTSRSTIAGTSARTAPEVTRGRLYLAMLAAWAALTLTLTSIPNPVFAPSFPGADKVAHFGFYGVMGFLFVLWGRETGRGVAMAVVSAAIFAALLGAVDEVHQQWIPGRSMEFLDWVADFAGGTAGGFCASVAVSMIPFLLTSKNPPFSRAAKD